MRSDSIGSVVLVIFTSGPRRLGVQPNEDAKEALPSA